MNAKKIFGMAWEDFKKNWVFLVLAVIFITIIDRIVGYIISQTFIINEMSSKIWIMIKPLITIAISGLVLLFFYGWLTKEILNIVDEKKQVEMY